MGMVVAKPTLAEIALKTFDTSDIFEVPKGMPLSVFQNKYARVKHYCWIGNSNVTISFEEYFKLSKEEKKEYIPFYQTWEERISEVIAGNFSILEDKPHINYNFENHSRDITLTSRLAKQGLIVTSGRHLQHGDINQANFDMMRFTNCSTSMFRFIKFYLLLQGSGVSADYSNSVCRVNFDYLPQCRFVLSQSHPDYVPWVESLESARHKYDSDSEYVRWFEVSDDAEGWARVVEVLETAAWQEKHTNKLFIFDFSKIRKKGDIIRGQQNRPASGPVPYILALLRCISVTKCGLKPWVQALYFDHYLSEAVQLGGIRRCLPEGTMVHTTKGLRPIEKIKVGEKVITPAGIKPITAVFDQGKQKTVLIKHQFGEFECTPNHKMAVFDTVSTWVFKEARYLEPGDRLVFDSMSSDWGRLPKLPSKGRFSWIFNKNIHDTNSIDITIPECTHRISWLLGYIHGNGYIAENTDNKNKTHGNINIPINCDFPKIKNRVIQQLKKFNLNVKVLDFRPNENIWSVRASSIKLIRYFYQWLKKPKTSLYIPACIKNAPEDHKWAYLAGIFDSDGSNYNTTLCSSIYPDFLKELQILFLSLGVLTSIKDKTHTRDKKWQPLYTLSTKGYENISKLNEYFPKYSLKYEYNDMVPSREGFSYPSDIVSKSFDTDWGSVRIKNNSNKIRDILSATVVNNTGGFNSRVLPVEVLGVVPSGRKPHTYDIEVKDIHQFTANGFVTHNSARAALKWWKDKDIFEFIDIKRGGFLWSANNSVIVDDEFWEHARQRKPSHARRVFEAICSAAYHDNTGEPGFYNISKINNDTTGLDLIDGQSLYSENTKYGKFHRRTKEMIDNIFQFVRKNQYYFIANPCVTIDTWVLTSDGPRQVKELIGKPFKAVVNGEKYRATGFVKTGTKPVLKILTNRGFTMRLTENHQVLIKQFNKEGWCEAGDLIRGDNIVLHNHHGFAWLYDVEGTQSIEYFSSMNYKSYLMEYFDNANITLFKKNLIIEKTTKSYQEAALIQRMLARIGVICDIALNGGITTIKIKGKSVEKFAVIIGFTDPFKDTKLRELINKHEQFLTEETYTTEVIDIIEDGVEDVYDCSVDVVNRFDANGMVVHNCYEIPLAISGGFCVVGDLALHLGKSINDVYQAASMLTKFLIRVNLMPSIYEQEVHRTNRIGVSAIGIFEAAYKYFGFTFFDLIDEEKSQEWWKFIAGIRQIVEITAINYSEELGLVVPLTALCLKPGGCNSPDNVIKTSEGDISFADLFNQNGYDFNSIPEGVWLKPVKDVYVYDENNEKALITKLYTNGVKPVYELEFEDGLIIEVTGDHKVLTNRGMVEACLLTIDDEIISY